MSQAIKIKSLSKSFGPIHAVRDVSFDVGHGEVLGFLGPNGAGKSTTMKMITGFLEPTSGTVEVDGHDVLEDALSVKRSIGYLPEGAPAYGEMTVRNFLNFIADIRELRGSTRNQRLNEVIETINIENANIRLDTAFTSGDTPILTILYMYTGKVVAPPPATINVIIKSSIDITNANMKPDKMPGVSRGKVIVLNVDVLSEYKSRAANSKLGSIASKAALIGINANGMQNTVWAIITLISPRLIPRDAKKINVATAVTISGTIKGNVIKPLLNSLKRNSPPLTSASAEKVAIIVANGAAAKATIKELIVAVWISSFENNLAYQRNEKPVHIIANLLELKL